MKPHQRELMEALRAAVAQKSDSAQREALLGKVAWLERYFEEEPRLEREAWEAIARLAKAQRVIFWARLAIAGLCLAVVGAVAWFLVQAAARL